jgi:hypothetical protein
MLTDQPRFDGRFGTAEQHTFSRDGDPTGDHVNLSANLHSPEFDNVLMAAHLTAMSPSKTEFFP